MKIQLFILALLTIIASSCKEPYEPVLKDGNADLLVVEGFINTAGDTHIKLSRTIGLSSPNEVKVEPNAELSIEVLDGPAFPMLTIGNGNFFLPADKLPVNGKFTLKINTYQGKLYSSELIEPKATPPIDSISWKRTTGGLQIYANTHDPDNQTRYYQWEFEDTWQIRSTFRSYIEYQNGALVDRDQSINITNCWTGTNSTDIKIGNSAKLSSDLISEAPIQFLPEGSERLSVLYSILVKQYALSKEAYEYMQLLKKNTEQLGSIFDPQPSGVTSNIRCVSNPEEPVIGFISAGTVQEKRIFIANKEVPDWNYRSNCKIIVIHPDSIEFYRRGVLFLSRSIRPPGVQAAEPTCVDCRLKGSNIKPDFWPIDPFQ